MAQLPQRNRLVDWLVDEWNATEQPVQNRLTQGFGMFAPVAEYQDGSVHLAWPSIVGDTADAMQRLNDYSKATTTGQIDPFGTEAAQAAQDAFTVGGVAATGSLAAGVPKGAIGSNALRHNPDLPMDHASRMARAREMGFDTDTTWYHGTKKPDQIDSFDPKDIFSRRKISTDNASFFTNQRDIASGYAGDQNNAAVFPVMARTSDVPVLDMNVPEAILDVFERSARFQDNSRTDVWPNDWGIEDLKYHLDLGPDRFRDHFAGTLDAAFDDYIIKGLDGRDLLVIKDPTRLRSVNAAFDPAKADSANLLAANPKTAPLAPMAVNEDDDQYRQRLINALAGY